MARSSTAFWVRAHFRAELARSEARAREEGRAQAMALQQKEATKALHKRLDDIELRAERIERITQNVREVLIRGNLMVPSDTQVGMRHPKY